MKMGSNNFLEPSEEQLNILLKYYQDGLYIDAEKLSLIITKKFPKHQFAWKVLAATYNRTNKITQAIFAGQKSVLLNPKDVEGHKILGVMFQKIGRFIEAEGSYRKVLALKPDYIEIHNILGVMQYEQCKFNEAEESYRKIIELKPDLAEAYNNLSNTLKEQSKFNEAEASSRKAIALKPEYVDAHYNMGIILYEQRKFNEAEESYRKVIALKPDHVEAFNNLSNTLKEQGRVNEAEESCRKSITLKPDHVEAYNNLGVLFQEQHKFNDAEASYKTAISLKPDYHLAYSNLGNTLQELGKLEEAIASYNKAIEFKADFFNAYHNKNMCLNYSSSYSPLYIYEEHLEFEKQFGGLKDELPFSRSEKKKFGERLRIGYVSGDFREHSVAYFFEPLLQNHNDKTIETFCYYNNTVVDATTKRLMTTSDHWRSIFGISDLEVSKLIRSDKIDILVDLSGHTGKNRLLVFAQKPAPIQVTWLGYPNTTGLSAIDYRFTDIVADPIGEADKLHSETLLRLPNGFQCFQGNEKIPVGIGLPQKSQGYVTFGSFNNSSKLTPQVIKTWSKILNLVPKSQLVLKCMKLKNNKNYYLELFKNEGITDDRIKFYRHLPSTDDHLKLYNTIDIGLDPFPYNGATTTCEALWMGVPVITLLGDIHVGRVGASILTNVGLTDFITQDIDGYVKLAVKMAANTNYLKTIKETLREQMQRAPICNTQSFANDIETVYHDMWLNYQK